MTKLVGSAYLANRMPVRASPLSVACRDNLARRRDSVMSIVRDVSLRDDWYALTARHCKAKPLAAIKRSNAVAAAPHVCRRRVCASWPNVSTCCACVRVSSPNVSNCCWRLSSAASLAATLWSTNSRSSGDNHGLRKPAVRSHLNSDRSPPPARSSSLHPRLFQLVAASISRSSARLSAARDGSAVVAAGAGSAQPEAVVRPLRHQLLMRQLDREASSAAPVRHRPSARGPRAGGGTPWLRACAPRHGPAPPARRRRPAGAWHRRRRRPAPAA